MIGVHGLDVRSHGGNPRLHGSNTVAAVTPWLVDQVPCDNGGLILVGLHAQGFIMRLKTASRIHSMHNRHGGKSQQLHSPIFFPTWHPDSKLCHAGVD